MRKAWIIGVIALLISSFSLTNEQNPYRDHYFHCLNDLRQQELNLLDKIKADDLQGASHIEAIKLEIEQARLKLKNADLWLRYLEPIAYKRVNGPLPVEWENEVFEKFEKPYKRTGAGLSLAEIYLGTKSPSKDSLAALIQLSLDALNTFYADSITRQLDTPDHFFFCNRLYLLNLAAIYTTGFECPGNGNIIPELRSMIVHTKTIYAAFNQSFPAEPVTKEYLSIYDRLIDFVNHQPDDFEQFDNFTFIKDYVNPLFAANQKMIATYKVVSNSFNDYTLNDHCSSLFDKSLYAPQNSKGVFSLVTDTAALHEIRSVGKLLFYDPILSGNNERTCASCHKPKQYFTDTSVATALKFDQKNRLPRNTPTLINAPFNHLLMLDGRHISLQNQGKDVITNPDEMGGTAAEVVEKVMSCKEYRSAFKKFLQYTPELKEVTMDHIVSAITLYYGSFSNYYSPFDEAMNGYHPVDAETAKGFNLFMSKAQCATCHYVPQFNGVPPPYIGSEFEVIGVPEDAQYSKLSSDEGRYKVNPAPETKNSFRTGSIRNAPFTRPYMHNGVFNSLDEVIDFYNAGGGAGKKLAVSNQTLASDSLKLTETEKKELLLFIRSLNEHVVFEDPPEKLPVSSISGLNERKVGGVY